MGRALARVVATFRERDRRLSVVSMISTYLLKYIDIYRDPLDRLWSGIDIYIAIFGSAKECNSLAVHGIHFQRVRRWRVLTTRTVSTSSMHTLV